MTRIQPKYWNDAPCLGVSSWAEMVSYGENRASENESALSPISCGATSLTENQVVKLLQRTGGLPLAIIRTISRMIWRSSSVETEIQKLTDPQNEIYGF